MKANDHKPTEELEKEIMEFIFSNRCEDHRAALEVWNNNPWIAVSMYEIEHYPENLGLSLAFPKTVEVPKWFLRKLRDEEMYAMQGEPLIIGYPRAKPNTFTVGDVTCEINKFGRVITPEDGPQDID